ncbi:MAG: ABC transporter permease [Christensenellales bacterium]
MTQYILSTISLGLLWAIMTLGVYITFRILNVADMSAEGSITLGAALAARMISEGGNPWLTLLAAIVAGMAAGLITGILHTKLDIPALLSGILTMIGLYSVNLRVMGKANISLLRMETVYSGLERLLHSIGINGIEMGLPDLEKTLSIGILGAVMSFGLALLMYWFFGTELGSAIRATGNNQKMVRAQGINTDTAIIIGLIISNGLVALCGAMIMQMQNFATVDMGTGSIVIGLASLIIGEVLFGKRNYMLRFLSVIFGAVTYRLVIALVLKMGLHSDFLKLFTALTVIFALSLPRIKAITADLTRKVRLALGGYGKGGRHA